METAIRAAREQAASDIVQARLVGEPGWRSLAGRHPMTGAPRVLAPAVSRHDAITAARTTRPKRSRPARRDQHVATRHTRATNTRATNTRATNTRATNTRATK